MTFPVMECLAGHMGLDMALKKTKPKHWFTTSFMKQSIYGFCISNLLMYFAHEVYFIRKEVKALMFPNVKLNLLQKSLHF